MTTNDVMLSASSLIGDDVKNAQGEDLGSIKDLMINTRTGDVQYAVMSFGGFLGMGDKYFAIPMEALTLDKSDECVRLNVSKETLESAEGFDKDDWPDMSDPAFQKRISSHYGYTYPRAA